METYESPHTIFMREMHEKHPEWAAEQVAGRALLWDRKIDREEQKRLREARDSRRAYPYDVNYGR